MLIFGIVLILIGVLVALTIHRTLGLVVAAIGVALIIIALLFVADANAYADIVPGPGDPTPVSDGPATNSVNLYLLVLGALVPLVGYVLNHHAPWATEPVKGLVHAGLAAAVGVLYQAVSGSDLGLNDDTLLAVITAVVAAVLGHIGWRAANINLALGGGTNAGTHRPTTYRPEGY